MALSPPTGLTNPRPERGRLDGSQDVRFQLFGLGVASGDPRMASGFLGGDPSGRLCISEWHPAPTPASGTPLGAGKAPELMSCNYPLRRAAGRLLFAFAAASSSPARPRPAAALRVPARGSAAASSRNELSVEQMASKGDDPPPRLSWMGSSE